MYPIRNKIGESIYFRKICSFSSSVFRLFVTDFPLKKIQLQLVIFRYFRIRPRVQFGLATPKLKISLGLKIFCHLLTFEATVDHKIFLNHLFLLGFHQDIANFPLKKQENHDSSEKSKKFIFFSILFYDMCNFTHNVHYIISIFSYISHTFWLFRQ